MLVLQKFEHTNIVFFVKNADIFAENWQKSPKIVIKTSTPGWRRGAMVIATSYGSEDRRLQSRKGTRF
jgi:hypothetical protein